MEEHALHLSLPDPRAPAVPARAGRLVGSVAVVTGAESALGRAAAMAFAQEGADLALFCAAHAEGAMESLCARLRAAGTRVIVFSGDTGDQAFCRSAIECTVKEFGRLDVLLNHAEEGEAEAERTDVLSERLAETFRTHVFAYFYLTLAALEHLSDRGAIINTIGSAPPERAHAVDLASTKGAVLSFTRTLARALADRGIRVNAIESGRVAAPETPKNFPLDQAPDPELPEAQPCDPLDLAPLLVFLASTDSRRMTGQVLRP